MIRRLSYVSCDRCLGNPAQPADEAREARVIARNEGYTRQGGEDVCGQCSGTIDEHGWRVTATRADV